MFYDTSSTYREAHGKFFRSGSLLPDGSSSVLFFSVSFFLFFLLLFLVSFLFASPWLHNNPAKGFPCGQISTFPLLSLPLFWVATTVFFLFFPCTHSGKVEQALMVLRRWPCHHKDADTREAPQASLAWPKFSWSSSAIWTIFTRFRMLSFDQPTLSGPTQGLSVYSLFLISILCSEREEEVEEGEGIEKRNRNGLDRLLEANVGYAGVAKLDQSPCTSP